MNEEQKELREKLARKLCEYEDFDELFENYKKGHEAYTCKLFWIELAGDILKNDEILTLLAPEIIRRGLVGDIKSEIMQEIDDWLEIVRPNHLR